MSGHVRFAQPRDLDRVAALWTAITHHHEAIDPIFEMRPDADSEVKNLILGLFRDPNAQIFVYDDAGDLPGICIVRLDHSPPIMVETSRAEITDLGVRQGLRRSGIGRALVEEALSWARESGVGRVEIEVAKGNHEGQAFWRSQGFGDLMDVMHKRL